MAKVKRTCGDCVHEYACGAWNVGSMRNADATHCVNWQKDETWRGHWETAHNIGELVWCSECGWTKAEDERHYRFCPNCGAHMEVEDETD